MSLLRKITKEGTTKNDLIMSFFEINPVWFSNIFNLFYVVLSIILIIVINLFVTHELKSYIRFILLIPLCFFNIILNHFYWHLTARILTLLTPFFLIFVFPIFNQFIYSGMFIWFPYGIMIIGLMSFFVFSYDQEKFLLNASLLFFVMAAIFYDRILFHSIPHNLDLSFIYGDNHIFYQLSKILLVFFMYTSSLYIAKVASYKYCHHMSEYNKKLEEDVKERTEKLNHQNQKIKELPFANSHIVRASVARIIGLVNMAHDDFFWEDKEYCYEMIKESAMELDLETDKIAQNLIEEI